MWTTLFVGCVIGLVIGIFIGLSMAHSYPYDKVYSKEEKEIIQKNYLTELAGDNYISAIKLRDDIISKAWMQAIDDRDVIRLEGFHKFNMQCQSHPMGDDY
jgi:hypothetical protein